jgi:hypothetical protein
MTVLRSACRFTYQSAMSRWLRAVRFIPRIGCLLSHDGGSVMNATRLLERGFIRHPADIPIEIDPANAQPPVRRRMKDVSRGGLACRCDQPLPVGARVQVTIALVQPPFSAPGTIVWCRPQDNCCEVGIRFIESDDEFAARMVEQVCYIENYRQEVLCREGRLLDGEAAAREWIERFAASFPTGRDNEHLGNQ